MKYLIIIAATLMLLIVGTNKSMAQDNKDFFEVKVDGLGCPFCAYGLEKKFKELEGIDDVKIEMETGVMTFSYPAADSLQMDRVEQQVDAAGYTAVNVAVMRADGSIDETAATAPVEVDELQLVEVSFFVAGNCGMCKARIEKSAKAQAGVIAAEWDQKSKLITVTYDQSLNSQEQIEAAIAADGHDTSTAKASDEVYEGLPGCCQYDRQ